MGRLLKKEVPKKAKKEKVVKAVAHLNQHLFGNHFSRLNRGQLYSTTCRTVKAFFPPSRQGAKPSLLQVALEFGFAFLQKGRCPFLGVLTGNAQGKGIDLQAASCGQIHIKTAVDSLFGRPQRHFAF